MLKSDEEEARALETDSTVLLGAAAPPMDPPPDPDLRQLPAPQSDLSAEAELKRLKPPNKRRYEEEMEEVMKSIREKEAQMKSLGASSVNSGTSDLRSIRAEKDATIEKRRKIDSDLKLLNQEITKKMGLLSKHESNLQYKNEAKIDDAIKKLEWQLKVQNFKLSEEKKVVAEIDKMKRNKKNLDQYFTQKKEIDEYRDRQRRMREEREHYFKTVSSLKSREDTMKKSNAEKKSKQGSIKHEIDALYERKRQLTADYKRDESEFHRLKTELRNKHRKESFRKREEERRMKEEAWKKEMEEIRAQKEPFEDEKNLCNTLVSYLQKFMTGSEEGQSLASPREEVPDTSLTHASAAPPVDQLEDGKYILLRKSDDADLEYSGVPRRPNRRSRKGRKMSQTKPITHTPQIFSQFASLNLNAPSYVSEIPAALEQLQARKNYYEDHQVREFMPRPSILRLSGSFSSSGSQGSFESPLSSLHDKFNVWSIEEVPPSIAENQAPSETESGFHDMSRQCSKTESSESTADVTADGVIDELVMLSNLSMSDHSISNDQSDVLSDSQSGQSGQSTDRETVIDGEHDVPKSASDDQDEQIEENMTPQSPLEDSGVEENPPDLKNNNCDLPQNQCEEHLKGDDPNDHGDLIEIDCDTKPGRDTPDSQLEDNIHVPKGILGPQTNCDCDSYMTNTNIKYAMNCDSQFNKSDPPFVRKGSGTDGKLDFRIDGELGLQLANKGSIEEPSSPREKFEVSS